MVSEDKLKQDEPDEYRLRQIVEHLPFFAVMVDRQYRYVWVNRLDATLKLEDVIGKRIHDFMGKDSLAFALRVIERSFETGEVGSYQTSGYANGGMNAWYHTVVVPLPRDKNGDERLLLLSNDITQQKQAENALKSSEARFRHLIEASPDVILIVDAEQRIEFANRQDQGPLPPLVGRTIEEINQGSGAVVASECVGGVLKTGVPDTYEVTNPDTGYTYRCRVFPFAPDDDARRALIVATDITEQERAATELREVQSQLQHSQKLENIGQLAGGVAHDFNNFLMVVQNHLHFAKRAISRGEDPSEDLDSILFATKGAAELTQGLLTIARKQPHQPQVLDLAEFVQERLGVLRRILPESIQLDHQVADAVRDPFIRADAGQLEQVLLNLIVNARDAIDGNGKIVVRVDVTDEPGDETDSPGLELQVSDNGSGMDESTAARAFDPFFTTKEVGKGTGLGLSMVHSLVTQNGGSVRLVSRLGEGTTLALLFKQADSAPRLTDDQPISVSSARGAGESILVAEDDPLVRQLVKRILEGAGYRVLLAEDGEEAVEVCRGEKIDLILMDTVMPRLNGKDAYERIIEFSPNLKTIFMSGYSAHVLPQEFLEERSLTLLSKPYAPHELIKAVQDLLRGHSVPPSAP